MEASYTLFSTTGVPIRATCRVHLNEIPSKTAGQNPTSGALTARRVHRVVAGDSLQFLAWREYGDATVWRAIAEANGIDDPARLEPGHRTHAARGRGGRPAMTGIGYSNVFHVTIGGAPLTPTLATLLVGGWVDFGAGVPGAFQLTFRDPKKKVLGQAGARIGADVVLAPVADGQGAQSPLLTGEITGLETDYDGTGTFTVIRGYDLRPPDAAAAPGGRLPQHDRLRHRPQAGRARTRSRSARSNAPPRSTSSSPRPTSPTGTSCAGWPTRTTW